MQLVSRGLLVALLVRDQPDATMHQRQRRIQLQRAQKAARALVPTRTLDRDLRSTDKAQLHAISFSQVPMPGRFVDLQL